MARGRTLTVRWLGLVPYEEAWVLQRVLAEQRAAGLIGDQLLLLEHPPVYTMGRGGEPRHLGDGPAALRTAGAEYVEVDRGGSVTFHGPGQLVAYPILRLADVYPIPSHIAHGDVLRYVRALEQAVIASVAALGVTAERRPPYTGVWVGTAKLASIGVKLADGVTQHGLALNVCTDLSWFDRVIACGIADATATSLHELGARDTTPEEVAPLLAHSLATAFALRIEPATSGRAPHDQPSAPAAV